MDAPQQPRVEQNRIYAAFLGQHFHVHVYGETFLV